MYKRQLGDSWLFHGSCHQRVEVFFLHRVAGDADPAVLIRLRAEPVSYTHLDVYKRQSEGRAKRAAAEQELTRIEDELKQKMMEIRS